MSARHERLLKALQQPREKFWEVRSLKNGKAGEVFIYGVIASTKWYDDDVTPKSFKQDIDALGDIETLYVRINSPGGSVWSGNAIYNILRRVNAEVIVTIDGLAASAASIIAMAGDKVRIAKNGMLMIHDPWAVAIGNARELRKVADMLDKVAEGAVAIYQEKTGLPKDEIAAMLQEETWLTAQEALEKKFVDEIDESQEVAASLKGDKLIVNGQEFDASIFGVLPPFEGLEAADELRDVPSLFKVESRKEHERGVLRRALHSIAAALGFAANEVQSVTNESSVSAGEQEPAAEPAVEPEENEALADAIFFDGSMSDFNKHHNDTKGSGEDMSDVKTPQPVEGQSDHLHNGAADLDQQALLARIAELEQRLKSAEEMAKHERDLRVEAEFIDRVRSYGMLPVSAEELGPVMKRASEVLAKEDFDLIESVLKAAGAALDQSDLFRSIGYSGDSDASAVGQYRAMLKQVKSERPDLSEVEASLEAFSRLPEDVQNKVYELNVLPSA